MGWPSVLAGLPRDRANPVHAPRSRASCEVP